MDQIILDILAEESERAIDTNFQFVRIDARMRHLAPIITRKGPPIFTEMDDDKAVGDFSSSSGTLRTNKEGSVFVTDFFRPKGKNLEHFYHVFERQPDGCFTVLKMQRTRIKEIIQFGRKKEELDFDKMILLNKGPVSAEEKQFLDDNAKYDVAMACTFSYEDKFDTWKKESARYLIGETRFGDFIAADTGPVETAAPFLDHLLHYDDLSAWRNKVFHKGYMRRHFDETIQYSYNDSILLVEVPKSEAKPHSLYLYELNPPPGHTVRRTEISFILAENIGQITRIQQGSLMNEMEQSVLMDEMYFALYSRPQKTIDHSSIGDVTTQKRGDSFAALCQP
jgi:hypothetical protein